MPIFQKNKLGKLQIFNKMINSNVPNETKSLLINNI